MKTLFQFPERSTRKAGIHAVAGVMGSTGESELFAWVKEQESGGKHDSTGQFTISISAAWEKMGSFSLPFEDAWVLKLVQSAVRAGVALTVTQSRTETVFEWGTAWRCHTQELEQAMFTVQVGEITPLSQLGVGLRALARSTRLPFSISYSDGRRAIWGGETFMRVADAAAGQTVPFRVSVSHFAVGEAAWLFSLDNIDARRRLAAIAKALTHHCHWAPTEITLDGRPITNMFLDPVFGMSQLHQPMFVLRAPPAPGIPALTVSARLCDHPEGTADAPRVKVDTSAQMAAAADLVKPALAVGLVSMFLELKGSGKNRTYEPANQASQLVWLQDGVEVSREELALPKGMVALLVVCNAQDLETDISGFFPREGPALAHRRSAALGAISVQFASAFNDFPKAEVATDNTYLFGGLLLGSCLFFVEPVMGVMTIIWSGISTFAAKNRNTATQELLDGALSRLRNELWVLVDQPP